MTSARDSFLAALLRGLGEEGRRWDVKKTPAGRDWIVLRSAPGGGAATMLTPMAKANMASPSMAKWAGGWANTMPTPRPCSGLRSRGVNQTELERALLPTPAATEYGSNRGGAAGRTGPERPSLRTMLIGTPTPSDGPGRTHYSNGSLKPSAFLATPTKRDWRSGKASEATHARNARPLSEQAYARGITGTAALLILVEWMLGYPKHWLLDAASAVPVSPPTATRSSPPSPSRSPAPSTRGTRAKPTTLPACSADDPMGLFAA